MSSSRPRICIIPLIFVQAFGRVSFIITEMGVSSVLIGFAANVSLEKKTEQLLKWMKNVVPKEFFHSSGIDEVIQSYADIILWVERNSQYFESAKKKFAVGADGWLVAYAQIRNMTVVTSEQPAPSSKRKIKLPDVCNQFGVRWVDTFSMLRSLNIQFDLQKTD